MNIQTIKTHLATGVLPGASPVIILEDMSGPTGINAGQPFLAHLSEISADQNDVEIAQQIYYFLIAKDCNAFAWYSVSEHTNTLRFGALKL